MVGWCWNGKKIITMVKEEERLHSADARGQRKKVTHYGTVCLCLVLTCKSFENPTKTITDIFLEQRRGPMSSMMVLCTISNAQDASHKEFLLFRQSRGCTNNTWYYELFRTHMWQQHTIIQSCYFEKFLSLFDPYCCRRVVAPFHTVM